MATTQTAKTDSIIVYAWAQEEQAWDGKPFAQDLGRRPTFVPTIVGKACVWSTKEGRAERGVSFTADLARARADIAKDRPGVGIVAIYPANEADPLGRGRADAVRAFQRAQRRAKKAG